MEDWVPSHGRIPGTLLSRANDLADRDLHPVFLAETGVIAPAAGFAYAKLLDRRDRYHDEATVPRLLTCSVA